MATCTRLYKFESHRTHPSHSLLSFGAGSPRSLFILISWHPPYAPVCAHPYPPRLLLIPHTDIFFALNAVRVLSIVSLLLVFASSILVMVTDIEAVNAYDSAKQSSNTTSQALVDCEYIG